MIWTVEKLAEAMKNGPVALEGVPEDVYHSFFAMSASGLKNMKRSPGFWFWRRENPSNDTAARRYGRLVHMALGEPKRFKNEVVCVEGSRNAKAVKEEIEVYESAGKTVCKPDEYKLVLDIQKYCLEEHKITPSVFKTGTGERTLLWNDEKTGVPCKARLDWTSGNGIIFDFKTFDRPDDAYKVNRQISDMDYHVQARWYSRGFNVVYKKKPHSFNFMFIGAEESEKSNFIDLAIVDLDENLNNAAEMMIDFQLTIFAECIQKNHWPRTPPIVFTAQFPWETPR